MNPKSLALACAVAVASLMGYEFIREGLRGWPMEAPAPTVLFGTMLAAISLGFSALTELVGRRARHIGGFFGLLVLILGLVFTAPLLTDASRLQIELNGGFIFREAPLVTTLSLCLIGVALMLFCWSPPSRFGLTDVPAAAGIFLPVVSLIGRLYGQGRTAESTELLVTWPVAAGLLLIGAGLIWLNRQRRLNQSVYLSGDAVTVTRRLLPAAFLAPTLLGLLGVVGSSYGYVTPALAMALVISASILMLTIAIFWSEGLLMHLEAIRYREMIAREAHAKRQANSDVLTGLMNRRGWDAMIADVRTARGEAGVIMLDVDGLKRINDTRGHAAGDELLRQTGYALREATRPRDVVARLGGDEFAVLIVDTNGEQVKRTCEQLREALGRHGVSASIGHALSTANTFSERTWQRADQLMYQDKLERRKMNLRT